MHEYKSIQLVGTVTVGPKGQIVVPAEVRESMNIAPGDKLIALYHEHKKSVVFITEQQAQRFVATLGSQFADFQQQLKESRKNS